MEDSHQKQYKIIDSDDLDMLGTIIASNNNHQPPPLPVQVAIDKEAKRK